MADKANDPSTVSSAHEALAPHWKMIRKILEGGKAVKAEGELYLPKFPSESDDEYKRRKESAPWRPEFEDCVRSISSKPFKEETALAGEPSEEMKAIADDVDGRGNNLNVFAKEMFEGGVTMGAHGILIDYPSMETGATVADEKRAGARPYWVSVTAEEIISIRTERVGAKDRVVHLRLAESVTEVVGFEEKTIDQIRVIEPGKWQIWREKKNTSGVEEWYVYSEGSLSLSEVPFVFFATNERKGAQYVKPPLLDLAEMQIELYRAQSSKEQAYTMLGSPMLSANGFAPPEDGASVETGPNRILYAPGVEGISTSWTILAPPSGSLKEMRDDCRETSEDLRRLGMQPLLPKTGNVTATASGIEASKAHSAVGTWANALKDALEQAFDFTAQWMKSSEDVSVNVSTDFSVGLYGAEEVKSLITVRESGEISMTTLWDELKRRGVLSPSFDADEEQERLINEIPGDDSLEEQEDALVIDPQIPNA